MTIGIPRALFYFKNPFFWETFFKELGIEVLLSPPTNREIAEKGVKVSDPETCFSIKVLFGHILWLDGKVDYIFVPRLKTNREKLEYCPKFFGMPDLAKIAVKTPILTENFDCRKKGVEKSLKKLGRKLVKDGKKIKKAVKKAIKKEKEIKEIKETDFLKRISNKEKKRPKIVIISHQYNLYDDYVNLRIKEKLKQLGAEVIFIDEVPLNSLICPNIGMNFTNIRDIGGQISENSRYPKFHWEFGKEIMEKIEELWKYKISGAIEISSFQCGCDAVLKEFVEHEFKHPEGKQSSYGTRRKIPFLYLIIDEQTGEAGFQTRLEAFMDTIK